MSEFVWPVDLQPYQVEFYLRPHTARATSPFTRQQKVLALTRPIWVCRLTFRGPYWGAEGAAAYGPRLDALIARMEGGAVRVALWDFRRERPLGGQLDITGRPTGYEGVVWTFDDGTLFDDGTGFEEEESEVSGNEGASAGASAITFTNYLPGVIAFRAGDMIGGDGRPHIVTQDAKVRSDGRVTVAFMPPLETGILANRATTIRAKGWFRLTNDEAGANMGEVGQAAPYTLEFLEDI